MENASKALLIAGGVLIAMLILTVGIFLFNTSGQLGKAYEKTLSESEVRNFNTNFTKFEGRTNITAQEIVSLVNFVKDYNKKTDIEINVKVERRLNSLEAKSSEELAEFVQSNSTLLDDGNIQIKYYKCNSIEYNGPFGTASSIQFSEF